MRLVKFLGLLVITSTVIAGCSDTSDFAGPVGSTKTVGKTNNFVAPGPCPSTDPVGFATEVEHDERTGFSCPDSIWWPAGNVLGAPDGVFASMGGKAGNYIVVEMDKEIADGDGADLVVFSIDMGDGVEGYYNVYVSDNPDSEFILVDSVRTQGNWCIDLSGSGVTAAKFVKIEQYYDIPGFDTLPACSTSYGPDIDAIGVLNEVCMTIDELCEFVGAVVDTMCPPDNEYRNHGEYVSCVAHAATEVLREYRDHWCYDEYFREEVHGCVVSQRAQTDIGKTKPE